MMKTSPLIWMKKFNVKKNKNMFNFDKLADKSFVQSGSTRLRPFDIYEVSLTKIEKTILKGKNGTDYNIIALEFKGEGGIHTENVFIPNKKEDFERTVNTNGKLMPSSFDRFEYTLVQLLEVINPDGKKKIAAKGEALNKMEPIKAAETFGDMVCKLLAGKSDIKFFLKLVGQLNNGTWYARIPNSCVMPKDATKDTEPNPLTFISRERNARGMEFSNYEMTQMKQYQSAKPTNMDKTEISNPDKADNDLDDFDSLADDL